MLRVQEYLSAGKTVSDLEAELSIRVAEHPTDPLIILNYDQINSPKHHPIARECRGLTLEKGTWRVVARAFPRFFNYGEVPENDAKFDWSSAYCQEKCDGSLALLYNYNGTWRMNTRGSFAQGEITAGAGWTWTELFFSLLDSTQLKEINPHHTFVFELCSPFNKVVRRYDKPTLFLLTAFSNEFDLECVAGGMDLVAGKLKVQRPGEYSLRCLSDVQDCIAAHPDATFEGMVVRDATGLRMKIKSLRYVALHHLRGEGQNLFHPRHLMPFLVTDKQSEADELLTYFPEVTDRFKQLKARLDEAYLKLMEVWQEAKDIESQKDFALFIMPRTPLYAILFEARKRNAEPGRIWRDKPDLLLNKIFEKDQAVYTPSEPEPLKKE